ncbi:ricin B lectin domain-containing protein [Mycena rosella]|uniref:Ricin B lectin domain-containing protein n=1 Tax=Mycena rosella TaxID=1033263 RepID=A0AAD7GYC0_MYCRO|nr:ricin B lectin domain-containing protein [Mycena rosella]
MHASQVLRVLIVLRGTLTSGSLASSLTFRLRATRTFTAGADSSGSSPGSFSFSFSTTGSIAIGADADGWHDASASSTGSASSSFTASGFTRGCGIREKATHDARLHLLLPSQIQVFGDKCIDVTNGVNADGTKLQIWTCSEGNNNQLWTSLNDFTFQWSGTNKCIDLSDSKITDGNALQIWTCGSGSIGNSNQKWIGEPNPDTADTVITAASNADGAAVVLLDCDDTSSTNSSGGNVTWTVPVSPLTSQIKTYDNKCLDVPNGSTANGVKLQLWTCTAGNTNQLFKVRPEFSPIEWSEKRSALISLTEIGERYSGAFLSSCLLPPS